MKRNLRLTLVALLCAFAGFAQTNVSGGIYSNTTWSLSASPYIVTSDVVVFPGYTLTIEPGVVVKFEAATTLEIRQASLIAMGTSTDSIVFTSNTSHTPTSWIEIYLNGGNMISKFNYCNFSYATTGLHDNRTTTGDTLILKNSTFVYNSTGLDNIGTGLNCGFVDSCIFNYNNNGVMNGYGSIFNNCDFSYNQTTGFNCHSLGTLNNCRITHNATGLANLNGTTLNTCLIRKNTVGLSIPGQSVSINNCIVDSSSATGISLGKVGSVRYCVIQHNATGIDDHNNSSFPSSIDHNLISLNGVGLKLNKVGENITCNSLCNNLTYDLEYLGSSNVNVANNYWCTDSASIEMLLFDGHDNINYGIVTFLPVDSSCNFTTAIPEKDQLTWKLYPNPASVELKLSMSNIADRTIRIFDLIGNVQQELRLTQDHIKLDISTLPAGIYFVEVSDSGTKARKKFIKQ